MKTINPECQPNRGQSHLMFFAIGCMALVAIAYRVRRDLTGPELTAMSQAASWASLSALFLWIAADWLTGSTDRWFTTMTGAVPLAAIELACMTAMTVDTFREERSRRRRGGRHRSG